MNLLDVLQSASNAAAASVSGPVDLISMALRKAGVPVPQSAVGSTSWLREKGLLRDVEDPYARAIGESLGMLAPMVAAAKAPQIASGLLKAGDNLRSAPQIAGISRGQRGVFDLSGMTREQRREILRRKAEEFSAPLKAKGFDVTIEQSGSSAGPSFYVRVFDPTTGRYVKDPFRFSDHSKGPFQSQMVNEMRIDTPLDEIYRMIDDMRAQGPAASMKMSPEQEARILAKRAKNEARKLKKLQAE